MGNRLKDILKREEVSAYRLHKDLGLDKGNLSRFLNEKQDMSLKKLELIAEYLGYDIQLVKRKQSQEGGE